MMNYHRLSALRNHLKTHGRCSMTTFQAHFNRPVHYSAINVAQSRLISRNFSQMELTRQFSVAPLQGSSEHCTCSTSDFTHRCMTWCCCLVATQHATHETPSMQRDSYQTLRQVQQSTHEFRPTCSIKPCCSDRIQCFHTGQTSRESRTHLSSL